MDAQYRTRLLVCTTWSYELIGYSYLLEEGEGDEQCTYVIKFSVEESLYMRRKET